MINKLNKIFKNYHVVLKEGITANIEFFSKNDLKKIAKLDNTILMDYVANPSIPCVLHVKEEIFVDILITIKKNTIFAYIEGIYVPIDLTCQRFNSALCGDPNYFYKTRVNSKDYLYCKYNRMI